MDGSYILDGKRPVPIDTSTLDGLVKWSRWFETADRKVAQDQIGDYLVSTVFLGLDHAFAPERGPDLFETMIFDKGKPPNLLGLEHYQERCATWEEAEAQHARACEVAKSKSQGVRN